MFIGLPFIVRTIQPVLEDMSKEAEEAAATPAPRAARHFSASSCRCFYRQC